MQKLPGFFTYWDAREGKVWLQIDKWDVPSLYYESLPNGVGSNDVGLDRGQPGRTVHPFERIGPRVLLVAENERYERLPTIWSSERRSTVLCSICCLRWNSLPRIKMGKLLSWRRLPILPEARCARGCGKTRSGQARRLHVDLSRSAIYLPGPSWRTRTWNRR